MQWADEKQRQRWEENPFNHIIKPGDEIDQDEVAAEVVGEPEEAVVASEGLSFDKCELIEEKFVAGVNRIIVRIEFPTSLAWLCMVVSAWRCAR